MMFQRCFCGNIVYLFTLLCFYIKSLLEDVFLRWYRVSVLVLRLCAKDELLTNHYTSTKY